MSKEKVFTLLEEHRGDYLSGNYLKDHLGVSRNAIWKAIQALKAEGHDIDAKKNSGYRLSKDSDVLHLASLQDALGKNHPYEVHLLTEVPSTNTWLKELENQKNNTLVFAKKQTAGRGRQGRSFHALDEGGLYFSLLKTTDLGSYNPSLVTMACAVALQEVLAEAMEGLVSIKWVNDLYIHGKKVSGILTEGSLEMETGAYSSLIIGIGINVNTQSFPPELNDIATSMALATGKTFHRVALAKKILAKIEAYLLLTKTDPETLLARYKQHLLYLGESILFTHEGQEKSGQLVDLTKEGHLLVKRGDHLLTLHSGEIRIRKGDTP
ncbi:MAG TPA: biotin--[acetyl-CoA-carboxylase] ligase [Clostridiaceae bacterium]|nr:biotin--[acetyl-CoA-carboxylase] ligase [Clostridiaceae bacterium]